MNRSGTVVESSVWTDAVASLAAELGKITHGERQVRGKLCRVTVTIEAIDPLAWLNGQFAEKKCYWRNRDGTRELAGIGAAVVLNFSAPFAYQQLADGIDRWVEDDASIRLFGGLRFDIATAPETGSPWASFGAGQFLLPRFELIREQDETRLCCNLTSDEASSLDIELLLADLRAPSAFDSASELNQNYRSDRPSRELWAENVRSATAQFDRGDLEKVVLARETATPQQQAISPWRLLSGLRESTHASTLYAFQPCPEAVFIGASPEMLFCRRGDQLQSEAIAGTRPRGSDIAEDTRFATELLTSEKDRREHGYVVRGIRECLEPLCDELTFSPEVELLKLDRVQHLRTRISGRPREDFSDVTLLAALHPTPAVAGYPVTQARQAIRQMETFDRGWYAGPIGWLGHHHSEFVVALRCALVHANTLSLYSGAGLVDGSTDAAEWAELDNKISHFLRTVTGR